MTSLKVIVSAFLVAMLLSTASGQGGIATCCRILSSFQVHRDRLKSYYRQHKSSCPINAVVFTTVYNKRICSSPTKVWTKTSMAYLDGKNWSLQHIVKP